MCSFNFGFCILQDILSSMVFNFNRYYDIINIKKILSICPTFTSQKKKKHYKIIANGLCLCFLLSTSCLQILWPGGKFFLRVQTPQVLIGGSACDQKSSATISESGGSSIPKSQSGSFEQQLEATRRASELKKLLFG